MITNNNNRQELKGMMPEIKRMNNDEIMNFTDLLQLEEANENVTEAFNELNVGDIVYFEEADVVKIWSGFGWLDAKETEEFLVKYTESEGELVVEEGQKRNEILLDRVNTVNERLTKITNTAESVNIGAYIAKLEELKKEAKSPLEVIILDRKIKAMYDSISFEPFMKRRMLGKIDKANFKKKKIECSKKVATISGLSFPNTNKLLSQLDEIFPGQEKKNMKACIHIYDFILRNKMDEDGLFVYFALINIEGLLMEFNPLKEEIKSNLLKMINSL